MCEYFSSRWCGMCFEWINCQTSELIKDNRVKEEILIDFNYSLSASLCVWRGVLSSPTSCECKNIYFFRIQCCTIYILSSRERERTARRRAKRLEIDTCQNIKCKACWISIHRIDVARFSAQESSLLLLVDMCTFWESEESASGCFAFHFSFSFE